MEKLAYGSGKAEMLQEFFFSYFVATLSLSLMSTDVRFDDVMIFRSLGHNRVGRIEPDAWQFCQRLIELYVHCTTLQ